MDAFRGIQRLMGPIIARVRRVCMGAIIRNVNDSGNLQKMQVESIGHSVYDNVEKFEQFGFTSNPPVGLDAIIIERAGKHIIVAIGDRKYRIRNMEPGDTAIYDVRGQKIILNKTGVVVTDANGNNVTMSSSGITFTDASGNTISMTASGVNINGVLITKSGEITAPSTIVASGNITAADLITATGGMLSAHYHFGGTITDPVTGQMVTGVPVPIPV